MADKVAVFDYDGTIVRFDTTRLQALSCLLFSPYAGLKLILDGNFRSARDKSLLIFSATLSGKGLHFVHATFWFYSLCAKLFLNKKIVRLMQRLQNEGYQIVIASGSLGIAIRSVIKEYVVIGLEFEMAHGKILPKQKRKRPVGDEKLQQCIKFIRAHHFEQINFAISDSESDLPLLNFSIESYLVRGKRIVKWK